MKFLRIALPILSGMVFSGCFSSHSVNTINTSNISKNLYEKKRSPAKREEYGVNGAVKENSAKFNQVVLTSDVKKREVNYNGSIKGIVTGLRYDNLKRSWLYEIKGLDTSNGKLPYAKFYSAKKRANIGDYVYAILRNSSLVELYFIKKANKIKKRRVYKKIVRRGVKKKITKKVTVKEDKKEDKRRKRTNIGVPQEEYISFD